MKNAIGFYANNRGWLSATLIYFSICLLYALILLYAAYTLYEGAQQLVAYFNSCVATANDQLNYCLR